MKALTKKAALVLALSASTGMAQTVASRVLVIDEGVDFKHSFLAARAHTNAAESSGRLGADDDVNGFVDDISGWNAISNDAEYFPAWVRKVYVDNAQAVTKLFDIYTRIENGDTALANEVFSDPDTAQALDFLLGTAHGTHVAGIIVTGTDTRSKLASLNVFTSSKQDGAGGSTTPSLAAPMFRAAHRYDTMLAERAAVIAPNTSAVAPTTPSFFFDNQADVDQLVAEVDAGNVESSQLNDRFLKVSKAGVVNLSLGTSYIRLRQIAENMHQDDLKKAGLPATTAKTPTQVANMRRLVDGIFASERRSWDFLFGRNQGTLFVVAAGNDGGSGVPNAGNNEINQTLPANCSSNNPNVITIAATNPEGLLADFSNFGARVVNVGAWGTAVPSTAPENNRVAMSGTSMASPNVAGLASRIRAVNANLTPAQVRQILERTATSVGSLTGKTTSGGMVNATAAIDAAQRALSVGRLEDAISGAVGSSRRGLNPHLFDFSGRFVPNDGTFGKVFETSAVVKRFLR
jgi:subtilisin family serine protease